MIILHGKDRYGGDLLQIDPPVILFLYRVISRFKDKPERMGKVYGKLSGAVPPEGMATGRGQLPHILQRFGCLKFR